MPCWAEIWGCSPDPFCPGDPPARAPPAPGALARRRPQTDHRGTHARSAAASMRTRAAARQAAAEGGDGGVRGADGGACRLLSLPEALQADIFERLRVHGYGPTSLGDVRLTCRAARESVDAHCVRRLTVRAAAAAWAWAWACACSSRGTRLRPGR